MSVVAVQPSAVDARGRLRRTIAPLPAAWPADHAALYRAFLRWLDSDGVPPARARTTLVAVRSLLASFPGPVDATTLATVVSTLLADYARRGAAPGTLQQYGSALRLFQRFVAIQLGLPPAAAPSPTPEHSLAPLPPWMRPRLLEYIRVQSRGWRPEVRRIRTHGLAAHFTRVLSFLDRIVPMTAWADLTRATVETWIDHRLATGRKPRTVAGDVMLLRSFYIFLLDSEDVTRSPLQRPLGIRLPDMLPRFIPDDAVAAHRPARGGHRRGPHHACHAAGSSESGRLLPAGRFRAAVRRARGTAL